ncbi:hypothetical protein PGTUg99_024456 [Puccinia graminis f. sp. tritici]|uniref:Uncharacterized protein n=1 Tax=Puccinia graminis f. sp. tritici TaxID=56615 RepID=A0A5B0RDY8_PUCGR|nr:hypothetical protein PGTUg99_024456 [Puccinia graminis f. sp. tritici]
MKYIKSLTYDRRIENPIEVARRSRKPRLVEDVGGIDQESNRLAGARSQLNSDARRAHCCATAAAGGFLL